MKPNDPPAGVPFLLGILLLVGLFGYMIGRIATVQLTAAHVPPITVRRGMLRPVPTVHIEGIRDGKVVGNIIGTARLFIGDTLVMTESGGTFEAAPGPFLINEVSVLVPEGMQFVASKRGTKYYSVTSAAGSNLTPENRVYFRTAGEAEAAGYKK